MVESPLAASIWRHANGHMYWVLCISNTATVREGHPPDVVYVSYTDGEGPDFQKVWTRPLSTWHDKMTQVPL